MKSPVVAADQFVAQTLCATAPAWPSTMDVEVVAERIEYHGVSVLLVDNNLPGADWPKPLVERVRAGAMAGALWEMSHAHALAQLLKALNEAKIQPLMLKGSALAYTLYADPAARSRGDSDLLIPISEKARAFEVFNQLGYHGEETPGEQISYQINFVRTLPGGHQHVIDLHWAISNSMVLAKTFSYSELMETSVSFNILGEPARRSSWVNSMLFACMHRATHEQSPYYVDGNVHHGGDRLIWLMDLHLLAQRFTPEDWNLLVEAAQKKGLPQTCLSSLQMAKATLQTDLPDALLTRLNEGERIGTADRYLRMGHRGRRWSNVVAQPNMFLSAKHVFQAIFPPESIVRNQYPNRSRDWLPLLYLRRLIDFNKKRDGGDIH